MKKDRARIIHHSEGAGAGGGEEDNMAEQTQKAGLKNEKVGEVVSTKMTKTIVVEVSRRVPHPLYKRIIGKRKKFYAHDEEGHGQAGRHGAHHRVPPVEQPEAVAAGGSGSPGGAGGHAAGRAGSFKKELGRRYGVTANGARRRLKYSRPITWTRPGSESDLYDWDANNSRGGR